MSSSSKSQAFQIVGATGSSEVPRLESAEEIRQATKPQRIPTMKDQGEEEDTIPYRPVRRPPMAAVCVLFDGKEDGEWVPIRTEKLVIGRAEGDIVIPLDSMMSGKHAAISLEAEQGGFRWYLTDLQSTNGTYVRIAGTVLKHGQDLLFGSRRYRFNAAPQGAAQLARPSGITPQRLGTEDWQTVSDGDLIPSLVEITCTGEGQRHLLTKAENWLGRDSSQCSVVLGNDRMISPRHARLYRDAKGRWHIENAGSRNGTWMRITRLAIEGTIQFQVGEQRFLLRIF